MINRVQLKDTHLRRALVKAPLILIYFIAPFLIGIILSPTFADLVNTPEVLGAFGFAAVIAFMIYLNGFFGSVLFGGFLFFFLNAIKMQNRWLYWLVGFSAGMVFNLLYPFYTPLLEMAREMPGMQGAADINPALQVFPFFFGLCGVAVAWAFWREVAKGGELNAN